MTFFDYRYKKPPALGRATLITQLQRDLRRRNINLTGPRRTGKSCMARAIAQDATTLQNFQGIVFCDLKDRGIDGDDGFFGTLIHDMCEQLPAEVRSEWLEIKEASPIEKLNATADDWAKAGQSILFVLDGIDDTFMSLGPAWSFLCNFVERDEVTFLCTSRRRIRELCNTREKRDSVMSDRFTNPKEIEPLNEEDLAAIVAVEGPVGTGVASSVMTWSGGNPALAVALCEKASELAGGITLQLEHINAAANALVKEPPDVMELIWQDLDPNERDAFLTAWQTGELPPSSNSFRRLRSLGLLASTATGLKPLCHLMRDYAASQAKGSTLFKEWFGNEPSYLTSMKQVLTLRLGPKADDETTLVTNVRDAIEAMDRPDKAARAFRDIAEEALELIWDEECPGRKVPALRNGPRWLMNDRIWPDKPGSCLELLNCLTDDRAWESHPKKLNRKHFVLISHVQYAGDFKNHKNGADMTTAFLIATVASAVELVNEMRAVGLV
jgi:hypothetical protein